MVIFFENTEIDKVLCNKTKSVEDIYIKTIAEKYKYEKRQIVKELNKLGIIALLSKPKDLTVNALNKYLKLKSLGKI